MRHVCAAEFGMNTRTAFNSIFPDLAKKYGVPLYPFFLDGVATTRTESGRRHASDGRRRRRDRRSAFLPTVEVFLAVAATHAPAALSKVACTLTIARRALRIVSGFVTNTCHASDSSPGCLRGSIFAEPHFGGEPKHRG